MKLANIKTVPYGIHLANFLEEMKVTNEAKIDQMFAWWESDGKHQYVHLKSKIPIQNHPINSTDDVMTEINQIIKEKFESLK